MARNSADWPVAAPQTDAPYLHTVFTTPHELNAVHDLHGRWPILKLRGALDTLENRRPKASSPSAR